MSTKNLIAMKKLDPVVVRHRREIARKHLLLIPIAALELAILATLGLAVAHPSVTAFAGSAAPAAVGTYQISCFTTGVAPEPCLPGPNPNSFEAPVDSAVLLDAHVTDSSGHLTSSGSWIFQDCLLKRGPCAK